MTNQAGRPEILGARFGRSGSPHSSFGRTYMDPDQPKIDDRLLSELSRPRRVLPSPATTLRGESQQRPQYLRLFLINGGILIPMIITLTILTLLGIFRLFVGRPNSPKSKSQSTLKWTIFPNSKDMTYGEFPDGRHNSFSPTPKEYHRQPNRPVTNSPR